MEEGEAPLVVDFLGNTALHLSLLRGSPDPDIPLHFQPNALGFPPSFHAVFAGNSEFFSSVSEICPENLPLLISQRDPVMDWNVAHCIEETIISPPFFFFP
jgi:hypothetical protein